MVPPPRPASKGWLQHPNVHEHHERDPNAMEVHEKTVLYDLPDEVLTRVGEFVFQDAKNEWHSINKLLTLYPLLISKKITSIYLPVLYTHPHLTYRTLPQYRSTIISNPSLISHLKHLTVRLSPAVSDDGTASTPSPPTITPGWDHYTWDRERGQNARSRVYANLGNERTGQDRLLDLARTLAELAGDEVINLRPEDDIPPPSPPAPAPAQPDDNDDDFDDDMRDDDEESDDSGPPPVRVRPAGGNSTAETPDVPMTAEEEEDDDAFISRWNFRRDTQAAPTASAEAGSSSTPAVAIPGTTEDASTVRGRWQRRSERLRALRAEMRAVAATPMTGTGRGRIGQGGEMPMVGGTGGAGPSNAANGGSGVGFPNARSTRPDPPHHVLPEKRFLLTTIWVEDATIDAFQQISDLCMALNYLQPVKARLEFRISGYKRMDSPFQGEANDYIHNTRDNLVRVVKGWAQAKRLLALSFCPLNYSAADVLIDRHVEMFKRLACRHIRIVVPPDVRSLKFFAGDREAWLHLDDSPARRRRELPAWNMGFNGVPQPQFHYQLGNNHVLQPVHMVNNPPNLPLPVLPTPAPVSQLGTPTNVTAQATQVNPLPQGGVTQPPPAITANATDTTTTGLGLTTTPASSSSTPFISNVARAAAAINAAAAAAAQGIKDAAVFESAPAPAKRGWSHMSEGERAHAIAMGEGREAGQMDESKGGDSGEAALSITDPEQPAAKKVDKGKGKATSFDAAGFEQDADGDAKMASPAKSDAPALEAYGVTEGKIDYKGKGKARATTEEPVAVNEPAPPTEPGPNASEPFVLEGQDLPADTTTPVASESFADQVARANAGSIAPRYTRADSIDDDFTDLPGRRTARSTSFFGDTGSRPSTTGNRLRTTRFTTTGGGTLRAGRASTSTFGAPPPPPAPPRHSALSFPGFGLISTTGPQLGSASTLMFGSTVPPPPPAAVAVPTGPNNAAIAPAVPPIIGAPAVVAPAAPVRMYPPPDSHPDELLHRDTMLFELEIDRADFEDYRWFEFGSDLPSQLCRIRTGSSPWINVPVDNDAFEEYTYRSNLAGSEPAESVRQSPYVPPDSPEYDFDASDDGDFDHTDEEDEGMEE